MADGAARDEDRQAKRNARIGLVLLLFYFLLMAGFVGLNAFAPKVMEQTAIPVSQGETAYEISLGGLNLAVAYGLALILATILLAFFYLYLARPGSRR